MDARGLADLEAAIGHSFREPRWLEHALTHSSHRPERVPGHRAPAPAAAAAEAEDNEKLEFLGDAVLGALVSEYLIHAFPDWDEGRLSKSRAKLVNSGSLSEAARRLGLGPHLRLGRGEEKTGGRNKPALLADAYEAIVAAIYLDAGLEAARGFVERTLVARAVGDEPQRLGGTDAKSALQELLQSEGRPPAHYEVIEELGPDHRKSFTVEVRIDGRAVSSGSGKSKKEAEQAAAHAALALLASKDG